jgi:hypothetical protein
MNSMGHNIRMAAHRNAEWVRSAENVKEVSRLWLHGKLILRQAVRYGAWVTPLVLQYVDKLKEFGLTAEHELEDFAHFYYQFQQRPEWERQIAREIMI